MADRTLTINHADGGSETYTINRDKFAGVRVMTRKLGETVVEADPENITAFTTGSSSNVNLNGTFILMGFNRWQKSSGDGYIRYFKSGTQWFYRDYDGEEGSNSLISSDDVAYPWLITNWVVSQPVFNDFVGGSPTSGVVTETETISVDHTAVAKQQSKETTFGGSQSIAVKRDIEPLLSKVVGGAAAAYSLRDLNDKAGNNKVVEVRRSSDNEPRKFLAKEVSNGTLEAWVGAGNDGFVETWYDQSGNGKDAVQPASAEQPKIVNAGSLVDGGLLFEDNQQLDTTAKFTFASGTSVSSFAVNKATGSATSYLVKVGAYIIWRLGGGTRRVSAGANLDSGTLSLDEEELWVPIINIDSSGSGGTGNFFVDGTLASEADESVGSSVVSNKVLQIGGTGGSKWNGTINELIIYTSDQSANRPAIDANIKNQYEIS